jgi:hypothetical protein
MNFIRQNPRLGAKKYAEHADSLSAANPAPVLERAPTKTEKRDFSICDDFLNLNETQRSDLPPLGHILSRKTQITLPGFAAIPGCPAAVFDFRNIFV